MLSSPSITTVAINGGYQVAFVSATGGDVETTGTYGTFNTNMPAIAHTSPSIAGERCSPVEYLLAWHSPIGPATGTLVTAGVTRPASTEILDVTQTNQPMNLTSSPSSTSTGGC
jgi:hypothetical protein